MPLPPKYNYIPFVAASLYAITTPVGIAAGLGIRNTYNPDSTTASIVSGVMDSLSAGILLYTGLVEVNLSCFLFFGLWSNGIAAHGTRVPIQQRNEQGI